MTKDEAVLENLFEVFFLVADSQMKGHLITKILPKTWIKVDFEESSIMREPQMTGTRGVFKQERIGSQIHTREDAIPPKGSKSPTPSPARRAQCPLLPSPVLRVRIR